MKTKPNVLFIMSDQHSAKVVGHKGIFPVKTPNLDRLTSEGVRFDCCVTQNPICTPSRVSFHSGQYCHNHGYYALSGPEPGGLPTVFGWFRNAGYRTAAIGKIHCPAGWIEKDCDTFIDAVGASIGGNPEYRAYQEERGVSEKSLNQRTFYEKYTGKDAEELRKEDPSLYLRTCDGGPSEFRHEDTPDGFSVRAAIDFMREASSRDKPFFIHTSFKKPHQLYSPSRRFWDLYDDEELILPPNIGYEMEGKSPHLRRDADFWRSVDWSVFEPRDFKSAARRRFRGYLGNVSQVDHAVGELLDWLVTTIRVVTFPWGLGANTFKADFLDGDGRLNPRRFQPFQTLHYI